jgi:ketosteroid isomerase-like protein
MNKEAKQVVTAFLTAVQQGNNEVLPTLLHPSIQWSQPGNNILSGTKQSLPEVFAMVGKMFGLSANTLRLAEFKTLSTNGNKVACVLQWTATRPGGESLDVANIDVYTVEDGQVIKAEIFTADEEAEDAFWGR